MLQGVQLEVNILLTASESLYPHGASFYEHKEEYAVIHFTKLVVQEKLCLIMFMVIMVGRWLS